MPGWAQAAAGTSTHDSRGQVQYPVGGKDLYAVVCLSFGAFSGSVFDAEILCVYAGVKVRRPMMSKGAVSVNRSLLQTDAACGIAVKVLDARAGTGGRRKPRCMAQRE